MSLSILVKDTQSTPAVYHLPDAYGLRLTTVLPGGCGECSFRVAGSISVVPPWAQFGAEVQVLDGGAVFWAGRIDDVFASSSGSGEEWEITAIGWGARLDDEADDTSPDLAGVVTTTAVTDFLATLANQFDVLTVTASGFTIDAGATVQLKLYHGRILLALMMRFGDSNDNPQQWHVYPRDNGDLEFTWEARPTSVGLHLSRSDLDSFAGGIHGSRLANRVIVRYNAGASFVTVNSSANVDGTALQGAGPGGWGLIRTAVYTAPEIVHANDATQLGQVILEQAGHLRMGASSLSLKPGARLVDGNSLPVQPWRIRAGTLCQIDDLISHQGQIGSLQWNNSFLIVGTTWDEDSQELTLTPEGHDLTLDQVIAQAVQLFRGRHALSGAAN